MSDWQEVTRAAPCIVCGKPDWCGRTADDSAIRCMRSSDPPDGYRFHRTNPGDGGTTFLREDQTLAAATKRTEGGKPAQRQFDSPDAAVEALERTLGKASAKWTYHDANGEPVGMVIRWNLANGTKEIRPVSRAGPGWQITSMPEPRPLYGLSELADADPVFVTEGEPAADALRELGLVATTSFGGSQAAGKTDWAPLGGKQVVLLPDNDASGERYAADVFRLLNELEPRPVIKAIALQYLPAKGDAVQYVEARRKASLDDDQIRAELLKTVDEAGVEVEEGIAPGTLPWRPFPIHLLPRVIQDLAIEGAEAIGVDPAFVAIPALVTCGSALGMTSQLECTNEWKAPPILWAAIIARSGCRKSPAFRLATQVLQDVEDEAQAEHKQAKRERAEDRARRKANLKNWEGGGEEGDRPIEPPEPTERRHVISDVTIEVVAKILQDQPRGVVVLRDEIAGFFRDLNKYRNGKGADIQNWNELWQGRTLTVDRVTKPRTRVSRAAVSIVGTTQPSTLRRLITPEMLEAGFGARWLFIMPPSGKRMRPSNVNPDAKERYESAVRALLNIELDVNEIGRAQPRDIGLSQEADRVWWRFFDRHATRQDTATDDVTEASLTKLEEMALRFALIFWAVRKASGEISSDSDAIDGKSMRDATELVDWFVYEHERIFDALKLIPDGSGNGEVDVSRRKAALIEFIRSSGGSVTARMVMRGKLKRTFENTPEATAALNELVRTGVAKKEHAKPGRKGGGASVRYTLVTSDGDHEFGDTTGAVGATTLDNNTDNGVVSRVTTVTNENESAKDENPFGPRKVIPPPMEAEETLVDEQGTVWGTI